MMGGDEDRDRGRHAGFSRGRLHAGHGHHGQGHHGQGHHGEGHHQGHHGQGQHQGHHGRGPHQEHRGGGRRRGGGVLDHGELRYVLLDLIAEKPRYGYELIKAVEEKFGGRYSPSPGVIYPTLTLLEELGYIRPEAAEGPRRLFAITAEGAAFLAAHRTIVEAILARMAVAGRAQPAPAPEIRRAMHNLEEALSIRLDRGPLDVEAVWSLAGALDRAAAEIERS